MKLPAWLNTKADKAARVEREAARVAREELFECLMLNVPNGMNPAPEVRRSVRDSLDRIDAVTAHKVKTLVEDRRSEHTIIVLMVWDSLERRTPNGALRRIADNFDYILRIGWGYTGTLPGYILRAFPKELIDAELTTEQQQALLRLEDSRWRKDFTVDGGSKTLIRKKELDIHEINDLVLSRPHDIERIIDLAVTRQPQNIDDYLAVLGSAAPEPLKDGEL